MSDDGWNTHSLALVNRLRRRFGQYGCVSLHSGGLLYRFDDHRHPFVLEITVGNLKLR